MMEVSKHVDASEGVPYNLLWSCVSFPNVHPWSEGVGSLVLMLVKFE
jgi:hypothetical protein